MSALMIHQFYAGLAPWLALSLLLLGRNPHPSRKRITGSLLLALVLLRIPVMDWSSYAWIRDVEANPSFILTALLAVALCRRVGGPSLFGPCDWKAAWIFGSAAALVLYPMGLGLTRFDSYELGWLPALPVAAALIASTLLLGGNRFGIVLLLPLAGFFLHLQESRNFWDALVDPIYSGISLIVVLVTVFRKRTAPSQTPQCA